jgi:hypothetical protein
LVDVGKPDLGSCSLFRKLGVARSKWPRIKKTRKIVSGKLPMRGWCMTAFRLTHNVFRHSRRALAFACQARPRKALLVYARHPARHQTPPQMPPSPETLGMHAY